MVSQAARLSLNIRSITVERGIATLAHQTYLPTLLSRSNNRSDSNVRGISSVPAILSRISGEEAEELEGWYPNDEDGDS